MDQILLAGLAVFYPVGDPVGSQGGEAPPRRRVDQLLPLRLGVKHCIFYILPQDLTTFYRALNVLGDIQTYLLTCIHLFLGLDKDFSQ